MLFSTVHQEKRSCRVAEIFSFSPKFELDAIENLHRFIEQCKTDLTVFGADLDWQEWRWPKAGNFTKLGANSRTKDEADKLDESFIDFSKAYFRYQQGHRPTGTKNELKALRSIEAALLQSENSASVSNITISTLDQAAQIIREHYAKGSDYHGGRELERLAKFITLKKLVAQDLSCWRTRIQRKKDEIQTGQKAKDRRESKMPSEEALAAMAEIFANMPTSSRDIFTSAVFAMLMCAPSRITEVLELPFDCEVEQEDSKGVVRYGWRFYSGKGFGANIKWIPTEMVGVAKEAISRIKALTLESRKLAKWMETNPDKFYRHQNCPSVNDSKPLNAIEACQAIGVVCGSKKAAQASLSGLGLPNKDEGNTLEHLWQYALSRQPKEFPWLSKEKGIKYSNALFCMRRNLLHNQRGTSPVIIWKPTNNIFNNDLSPRESLGSYHKSIFDRYGYKAEGGGRIKLTSHQARHLLNTIAQRGGLSQLQIAKWSGRAEVNQNRTYNHMSEYEMVALAEELDTSLTLFGPSGEVAKHVPISIQEFNTMEKGAVHVTEFGVCVHDFTMSPCEKYRDCLNCSEQVCVKGEHEKLDRIKKRLEHVEIQFKAAKQAIDDGLSGADRWYEYHKNTMDRLKELVTILESSDVADGAQIKLRNDKAFSPLRRAVESKTSSPDLANDKNAKLLDDMTKLLGGGLG
jgi:hypothetical protein